MTMRDACPECGSPQFKKNGHIHNGKQNHQCKKCGRQFVLDATNRVIDDEHRPLVERLLCEKISRHGICRAIGVSIRWLMDFLVARFEAVPDHLHVQSVTASRDVLIGRLEVEADELWSFVQKKTNYTDQYAAYTGVIPAAQHKAITKSAGKTNHSERFNNTLRQRVSRLVRSTLAFSKNVENHIGAIRYFICHDNLTRTALLV